MTFNTIFLSVTRAQRREGASITTPPPPCLGRSHASVSRKDNDFPPAVFRPILLSQTARAATEHVVSRRRETIQYMPNPSVVLATAGYDHTVRFWEATRGICYRTLQYADSQVRRGLGRALRPRSVQA